jgi:putative FmdB family regulatory protein
VPIYEYQCVSCAHRFELKQSIKDDPIKECPRCAKEVTKLISSPAIMFKGSGWYITDYSDKMKPGSGGDSPEKAAAPGSEKTTTPASSETTTPGSSATPAATPSAPASSGSTTAPGATKASTGPSNSSSSSSSAA